MKTYCNPINLNYWLQAPTSGGTRNNPENANWWFREAADPSVAIFDGEYYLFSSITKGYWTSKDLATWDFIALANWEQLPNLKSYAPTVVVLDGVMYLAPGNSPLAGVFKTAMPKDPSSWVEVPGTGAKATGRHYADAQYFYDEEFDKLYYVYGCYFDGFLYLQELNKATMLPDGYYHKMHMPDFSNRGWERPGGPRGNNNGAESAGWVEGGQMFKHNGLYYWIYSGPDLGNAYYNAVYTATNIKGPWTFQPSNPVTQKLTGFAPGSGHGEMFKDLHGNWWSATCQDVWALDRFERRISLFPTFIDETGQLMSQTWLGDYPIEVPQCKRADNASLWTGWNLLSYRKPVIASSQLDGFGIDQTCNEDIRTWWSAATGDSGEWLQIDLGQVCQIRAVQINFAEQDIQEPDDPSPCFQYQLLGSPDGAVWEVMVDKNESRENLPHAYLQLPEPVTARHLRLINRRMPFGGKFAVRDLRVFGHGTGAAPEPPSFSAERNPLDGREATVIWASVPEADGYVLRYGIKQDELYHSQQIYGECKHRICSLTVDQGYYLTVDAFNANGYSFGTDVQRIEPGVNPRIIRK
ncbi:MAG: family 43 glycosylhydrolase [Lentisphaeria bacterium]|nr:family 43 glycosylhydrolase [Lentisphaeria bacterium]